MLSGMLAASAAAIQRPAVERRLKRGAEPDIPSATGDIAADEPV
jgi:hypothetical protein